MSGAQLPLGIESPLDLAEPGSRDPHWVVYTWISGGVTGYRDSYMKGGGEVLKFRTREAAERYVAGHKKRRSPGASLSFDQFYEVQEVS